LAHAQALKQATAGIEFNSTLPPISSAVGPGAGGVTDKIKRSLRAFHRLLPKEKFAIEKFGRGSLNHLLAIANIERFKFRQLSTKEKRAWVQANSDSLIRSLPNWSSLALGKKAGEILTSQIRAFGTKHGGSFAGMLARDYIKEKRLVKWRMEIACHSNSMLPPDAQHELRVDGRASLSSQPNLPTGQTRGLFTQEHHKPSGTSMQSPIRVLPEHIKHQEEKVYVLGATQPHSSTYRKAVEQLELMWFLSLEAADRQVWMNKYSTPKVSRSAAWASKSETERAKLIIMSRVKDLESKTGIPQIVPAIGKHVCRLFSIDNANT
jgi:hypothetical protein